MQIVRPWRSILQISIGWGLCLAPLATPVQAQYGGPKWQPRPWQAVPTKQPVSVPRMVMEEEPPRPRHPLILVAGGVIGYAVTRGLIHGYGQIASPENCSPCVLEGFLAVPLFLAVPTLTPLGVHLANDSRGSLGMGWLASTTVGIGALLIGASQGADPEMMMIAVPASSILAAVMAELLTTPRRPATPVR